MPKKIICIIALVLYAVFAMYKGSESYQHGTSDFTYEFDTGNKYIIHDEWMGK